MYVYVDPSTGERFVVATKPNYEVGGVAAIKLPPKATTAMNGEREDDLIDEDLLLAGDTSLTQRGDKGGCGIDNEGAIIPGKKRACKNCSCGKSYVLH